MELNIGFSPCPNDTFIFYALLHNKIDTKGIRFRALLEDVETLNRKAINSELDITKISFAAYLSVYEQYQLLTSGSALGNNCGPLLISKNPISEDEVAHHTVAIPGLHTTANFLFDTYFSNQAGKKEMIFSEVEDAVLDGITDMGVIIHENRFTYENKGLLKIVDLGEKWERATGFPIPLGGIAILRSVNHHAALLVNEMVRLSVLYAFSHPEETMEYVRIHAAEMDEKVMWQHIKLYVTDYSINLGSRGKSALKKFFEYAGKQNSANLDGLQILIDEPIDVKATHFE